MKKQDIICVSMTTWEGDYMKAVVHMMGNLAKNNRVLFIDYAFTLKDLIKGILGQTNIPVKRMLGLSPRLRTVQYHGYELQHLTLPPILPVNWINNSFMFDFITNIQGWLISKLSIEKVLASMKFNNPIMINAFNPVMGNSLQKSLNISKSIYYCYDEISAAGWCSKHGQRVEEKFAKQVDIVVVTSTALLESKKKLNPNTVLIKNGVDFDLFHQAAKMVKVHANKKIGYIGSLDFRVDYDLLETLIQKRSEYEFMFIGRVMDQRNCERLSAYSNVQFLGSKQPEELPVLLSQIDVAIIPFVKNEFTRNIYPLKINEYLAAGLPVVSTDFADMSDFQELISIENNAHRFIQAIKESMNDTPSLQLKRIEMAKTNDWSNRTEQLENLISQLEFRYEKAS
ncbi:MAG: glycosyltransferase involved in cell wall biosynthesis [Cyclobacteriaceae bacterium]|jgi:glycosyltransferase involved in cell wall biosynthesis